MFATRFSAAQVRQAVDACRSGRHPSEVGRELGVSERTVMRWRRRLAADAGEAEPVASPSRATALLPAIRIFSALGDVALVWAALDEPVALADAKMLWGGQLVPEPLVLSLVGDPEQGYHLLALGRIPGGFGDAAVAPRIEVRDAAGATIVAADAVAIEPLLPPTAESCRACPTSSAIAPCASWPRRAEPFSSCTRIRPSRPSAAR